jgi:hypothetical protein
MQKRRLPYLTDDGVVGGRDVVEDLVARLQGPRHLGADAVIALVVPLNLAARHAAGKGIKKM